mgnify:FL=1
MNPGSSSHSLDTARLDSWLRSEVPGYLGPVMAEKFADGQSNPTYKLMAASGPYVLRRKPPGTLLASAHAVDREFRVIGALASTGVPVPKVHALCADESIIGGMFYVMEYVEGRVFWDPTLPGMAPKERTAVFDSMNATIARLHSVDCAAVGLEGFGRPGNYMQRQCERWTKQYRASETEKIEAMDHLIDWLPGNIPPAGDMRIVHGDYRLDNLIVHKTEPKVVAVLDWELSTLGDPLVDFAYHVMVWRIAPELFRGLAGAPLRELGIPSEAEYLDAYCRRTGRPPIANWDVYIIYSMFRIAAILQGVLKRAIDGNASNKDAFDVGRRGRLIAEQGWGLARGIGA